MNKEEDIFSDLEKDIEGDWKEIQTKIRNKENREMRLQKPRRPYFPSFKEFYSILVDIAYGTKSELEYTVQRLVRRMVYNHGYDSILPNTIIKLWEVIFNPERFECESNYQCPRCKNKFDIIYERHYTNVEINEFRNVILGERRMNFSSVCCPICGERFVNLRDAELVSVSLSPKDTFDDNYRRERRYDIKREF